MQEKTNWKNVVKYMGAVIAFAIGAGFATGQEVMQFFAAFGYQCVLAGLVFVTICVYTNISFAHAGHVGNLTKGSEVFDYYCGKYIGRVFDFFTVIFCYMSFFVMLAGASSTLQELFGLPRIVGATIIAGLAAITVIMGLSRLVDVIGAIGPIMITISIVIAAISLAMNASHVPEGAEMIASGAVPVTKAASNWFASGVAYGGFALLWFAGFVAELGSKSKPKELYIGVSLGQIVTIATGLVVAFALIASISQVYNVQIPNLVLARNIAPALAVVLGIVVFAAIYSSATPLLWTAVARFTKEKTPAYTILTVVLTVVALIVAFFVPFSTLVNVIYGINGYAGFVLVFFMVVKDIRTFMSSKKKAVL